MKSPTQRKIAALKPLEKRYSVALGYGLSLKVQPSGAKSFVLRLCVSGRVTDILLGHFPEMSFGEAKQAARRRRKEIGKEPPKGYVLADAFRQVGSATGGSSDPIYSFKASRSNSVYGRTSNGVSVDAVYALIIIKV